MRESWRAVLSLSLVAVGIGSVLGVLAAKWPTLAVGLALASVLLPVLVASAPARLLTVVAGALLVFQSEADAAKFGYLGLALTCVALSGVSLAKSSDAVLRQFRPMILGAAAVVALLGFSSVNAVSLGTEPASWFRDMLPYLLLAILPLIGLDAARKVSASVLIGAIGVAGFVSALAYAIDWLNRRGAVEGGGRVLLATATLPILAFCLAVVLASRRGQPNRIWWATLAVIIPAAMLVTGSRTFILVFAAALLGLVGSAAKARIPLGRLFAMATPGLLVTASLLGILAQGWVTNSAFVQGRIAVTASVLAGDFTSDASFQARASSYYFAWARFTDHFLLGGGPGHLYPTGSFTLDTPWQVPAKFGIIGSAVIVAYLLAIVRSVRNTILLPQPIHAASRGWGWSLVALLPFGPWMEDKGTALAFLLLVAATAAVAREQRRGSSPRSARFPERRVLEGVVTCTGAVEDEPNRSRQRLKSPAGYEIRGRGIALTSRSNPNPNRTHD
jgi:hypothetical protein